MGPIELDCTCWNEEGHVHSRENEELIRCLSFKDVLRTLLGKAHRLSDAPRVDQNVLVQLAYSVYNHKGLVKIPRIFLAPPLLTP